MFIGQGSSESGKRRGYVSAYDAETGELAWRFYLVPGDPSKPFEHPEMEMAAKTWGGEWWKMGGGGTAWNSLVYDEELNLLYIGVGNGAPWSRQVRSPGGGDDLFLTAIVAVDADTAEMKWYYQTVPGDNWDYSSAMDIALGELTVDGVERKVLLQAPKNGFFYVIDRETGELLRAHPYTDRNRLGHPRRHGNRPADREPRRRVRGEAAVDHARERRRAQLGAECPGTRSGASCTSTTTTTRTSTPCPRSSWRPARTRSGRGA